MTPLALQLLVNVYEDAAVIVPLMASMHAADGVVLDDLLQPVDKDTHAPNNTRSEKAQMIFLIKCF